MNAPTAVSEGFRLGFRVLAWEAWAGSRLSDRAAWQAWAASETGWDSRLDQVAPVAPMAPLLRRRADAGDRLALEIAFRLAPPGSGMPSVFASRHGQVERSTAMLKTQAAGEPASPMDFSLSVHNATAGQYSIAAGDRNPSASLCSRQESFTSALLEAQGLIAEGHPKALVVMSDRLPPEIFQGHWREEPAGYALGLVLGAEGGEAFELSLSGSGQAGSEDASQPQTLAFLRTLAGSRAGGHWQRAGRRWEWTRR